MINGEPNEFLDHINHDDAVIKFRGWKYFFDPKYYPDRAAPQYVLIIEKVPMCYGKDPNAYKGIIAFAEITGDSHIDCVNKFIDMPLWDGKTFWEVEKEMKCSDWDL